MSNEPVLSEVFKRDWGQILKEANCTAWSCFFKPNTDDMREAPSVPIAHELHQLGAELVAYDPVASRHAARELPDQIVFAHD
ncbi:UDP binding domain-containing protein [Bacillus sp. SL00103]